MACAWKALRVKEVQNANSTMKRSASMPVRAGRSQVPPENIGSGHAEPGGAAALLPDFGTMPEDHGFMGPALVRGTGPRKPRRPCEKSQWPHNSSVQLSEVPLTYPATHKIQRMLIARSRPSTCERSQANSRPVSSSMSLAPSRPESGSASRGINFGGLRPESGSPARGSNHEEATASVGLLPCPEQHSGSPSPKRERSNVPRYIRGGPLSSDYQAIPDSLEWDSANDVLELSVGPSTTPHETSCLAMETFPATNYSTFTTSDVGDCSPSQFNLSSMPGTLLRSDACKSPLSLAGGNSLHRSPTGANVEWLYSFISKAPSFGEIPQRPSKASMSPPLPRTRSEPSLPRTKLKGKDCQAALIDAHSKLRRLGNPRLQQLALEASAPSPKRCRTGCACCPHLESTRPGVPTQDMLASPDELAYMQRIISSCNDTPESLRVDLAELHASHAPIDELDGSRHPTTLVFARSLRITEQKLRVLNALVACTQQYEMMSSRKPEVIRAVINGQSVEEAGGVALGFDRKVKNSIHANPWGCPEEADKSYFDFFVNSMKLSKNHVAVLHAQNLAKVEKEPWIDALAHYSREEFDKECKSGDESDDSPAAEAIRRLFKLSAGLCLPEDHKKLIETEMLGNAAKARKIRIYAEAKWKKLEETKTPSKAREAAIQVEASVKSAIKWGLEKNHPDMRRAFEISHDLHGLSICLGAEDEMRLLKARTKLGDAEAAAERVEAAIKECIALGLSVSHPKLEEARKIAVKFREEEGVRKRQANREKQLAEKAAREAAAKAKAAA